MNITSVKIFRDYRGARRGRLLCQASVVLDDSLVLKDLKLIDGGSGWFVQFPSHVSRRPCPACDRPADVTARFCPDCGVALPERPEADPRDARRDVVHPIRADLREQFLQSIAEAYRATLAPEEASP
jgi:stage V sporulation protein G